MLLTTGTIGLSGKPHETRSFNINAMMTRIGNTDSANSAPLIHLQIKSLRRCVNAVLTYNDSAVCRLAGIILSTISSSPTSSLNGRRDPFSHPCAHSSPLVVYSILDVATLMSICPSFAVSVAQILSNQFFITNLFRVSGNPDFDSLIKSNVTVLSIMRCSVQCPKYRCFLIFARYVSMGNSFVHRIHSKFLAHTSCVFTFSQQECTRLNSQYHWQSNEHFRALLLLLLFAWECISNMYSKQEHRSFTTTSHKSSFSLSALFKTGLALAEGPRDAQRQLKYCQLLHNCTKYRILKGLH